MSFSIIDVLVDYLACKTIHPSEENSLTYDIYGVNIITERVLPIDG